MGWDNDIEMIKALRKETDATFRVDVNSGWSLPEAIEKINILKELDIQFVEEPLKRFDYENMKTLFSKSALPLMADESCVTLKDIEHCKSCYNGINIKLTKCGGLTPTLEMIQLAKSYNMKAMAHLLPLIDYIDIDGPLLLDKDIATGLSYENGKVDITHQPGLGIQFIG
jgi:L-alanine-DL-glutamate epimerase-like enolase superfamily enzyme